jgi:hypothetical protein
MDRVAHYRHLVEAYLTKQAAITFVPNTLHYAPVFDREREHYLLLVIGRDRQERVHRCDIHLAIVEGKVWLQELNADVDVLHDLQQAGIPAEDLKDGTQIASLLAQ